MEKSLDVYRDWLGIKDPERPLNYYQLLRVERFEDNIARIRRRYRKMTTHVRKYASGEFAAISQKLLNELARAMLCLTDLKRKAEYDKSLGRETTASDGKRLNFEQLLVQRGVVSGEPLAGVKKYASTVGLTLRDALLQKKVATTDAVMQVYAESLGIPFLSLEDIQVEEELMPKISAVLARQHSVAPVMVEGGRMLCVSPNRLDLQVEEDLNYRLDLPIRMVLCTPGDINRLIDQYYPREAAEAELKARSSAPKKDENKKEEKGLWAGIKKWVKENS